MSKTQDLKRRVWTWIQTHVDAGAEFRNVQLRKALRLTSDRSRHQLTYVLEALIEAGLIRRTARRRQSYSCVSSSALLAARIAETEVVETPSFLDLLAFVIESLFTGKVRFVRTADLHRAIAEHWNVPVQLLRTKTAWQQSYCWAMHRLERRDWVRAWNQENVEVSPALFVDLRHGKVDPDWHTLAAWLDKWWREYEAVVLRPSAGRTLLDVIEHAKQA